MIKRLTVYVDLVWNKFRSNSRSIACVFLYVSSIVRSTIVFYCLSRSTGWSTETRVSSALLSLNPWLCIPTSVPLSSKEISWLTIVWKSITLVQKYLNTWEGKKETHSQAFRYDVFSIKQFLNKIQTHGFAPFVITDAFEPHETGGEERKGKEKAWFLGAWVEILPLSRTWTFRFTGKRRGPRQGPRPFHSQVSARPTVQVLRATWQRTMICLPLFALGPMLFKHPIVN